MNIDPFQNVPEHHPEKNSAFHSIKEDEKSIAFAIYSELIAYENHYNLLQNKYKGLASTWIVATFVGIGYVLSGYEVGFSLDIFLTIMFLTMLSGLGIYLIWFLDAGVYYKFIESIFIEVIKLEDKYPFLGKSHHNIIKLHDYEIDPHTFHGVFYTSFILFLLTTAGICLSIYLYKISIIYFSLVLFLLLVGWIIFIILHKRALLLNDKSNRDQ